MSTSEQETENQVAQLSEWAERRGLKVVKVYDVEESAWRGAHRTHLQEALADGRRGEYEVLLTWALDRLTREGPLETLLLIRRLAEVGVAVWSLQEPWAEAGGELRDLLLAVAGWVARMESNRRSERTKAGLARAVAEGKRLGRPPGSKDSRKRKRSGYFARYAD